MAQTSPKPATVCAEHIAISHFFSLIPAPVVRNAIGQPLYPQKGKDYILPFSKERGLTELLAFLAKVDDGPDHIPAVCVEQNRAGTVLEVILAINKKSYTSGEEVIKELKQGFEKLFHILNEAQYVTDKFGVQKEIFTSIVLMCSRRIICRLRLEPNAEKMPIQALLKQALFSIGQIDTLKLERKGLLVTSLSFIAEANKVIKLVDHWLLRHRTQEGLEDIVEGLNHLRQTVPQLHDLLDQILNKDMAPSSRSSLMNIIRKVSRYSEATRKLYRMAKKFPLVRNMKIQLASLPEKAFQAQANVSELPDLSSCLSKLGFLKGKKQTVTQLCHNLKLDEKAARARYELARMACAKTKIHAEIQVIAFCEMRAPDLFPRVISSSKDACFLCNRFIEIYGRMHTPRTHGRLYPGWRLPSLPQFGVFQQKLNASLLESLRQDVAHGLAQGKLQVYPTPNESNILTMSVSETTISMPTLGSDRSEGDGSSIGSSIALSDDTAKFDLSLAIERPSSNMLSSVSSTSNDTVYPLEGEPVDLFVKHNKSFHLIATESLELHLSLEDVETSTNSKKALRYSIERLQADSIKSLSENCPVVDVRHLEGEVSCALSEDDNAFCLVAGNVILKINSHK